MSWYSGKMAELRKERGGRCVLDMQGCWKTRGLEFAHVKDSGLNGRGRGQSRRYHNIKQHPEAYILICRGCHAKADGLADEFHNYELQEEAPF